MQAKENSFDVWFLYDSVIGECNFKEGIFMNHFVFESQS